MYNTYCTSQNAIRKNKKIYIHRKIVYNYQNYYFIVQIQNMTVTFLLQTTFLPD